ncbi:permease-like cell division protein FtsX [Neisseria weaveri]|uniref:Cell division protein FtsX n=1 Tax=Neisseria weaveri TaxID=28091 RepID=A0A448VNF1_9NEIS|nr:permease-like cell division protein FtsX [Neisseria weaveri]EGV35147.1 cell division protein FtsX [Neisseria weaveri LMG 5135]SAY51913.1 Cell division protein ftsX-like protein [Neisseria weaveri]VEJ51329.1 Cell division protein ftsX-like protein [Neisseria weaveri]
MNHYLSLHWESARNAARQLLKQPFGTLLILLMLAIAMTLPLTLYLGVQSGQAVLGKLNESPQITVYMEPGADEVDGEAVKTLLQQDKRIEKSEFIGKQQGLTELQESMGGQNLVSMLEENPLPDVFIVTPQPETPPEAMQALQKDLSELPMVESAKLDTEWMQTLYQMNDFLHRIFWFLAVTLSVAFVLVAHNTIRLQILSRKEEIEITKLLGAPASFIRRPFLYQAAWQSVLSVIVSLGLCAWLIRVSQPLVQRIFTPYGLNIEWRFFHIWEIAAVLLVVAALGIAGAWLATQQHLLGFKAKK